VKERDAMSDLRKKIRDRMQKFAIRLAERQELPLLLLALTLDGKPAIYALGEGENEPLTRGKIEALLQTTLTAVRVGLYEDRGKST
jgi:hypothetical protein